jgi:hypothetical protein
MEGVLSCTEATGSEVDLATMAVFGACAPVSGTMGFAHAVRGGGKERLNRKYAPPKKQQKIIITLSGTNT